MPDRRFYVEASNDDGFTGFVPAKFLMRNGAYVMNPTPGGSQGEPIYSDHSGSNKTIGSTANPNNYLIVPENYTEQKARDFASLVEAIRKYIFQGGGNASALVMANAFEAGSKAPAPFNDYGYYPQPERQAGQIGDGRGIVGLIASLAGIDPQEPTPPQADRPIRYLGRVQ